MEPHRRQGHAAFHVAALYVFTALQPAGSLFSSPPQATLERELRTSALLQEASEVSSRGGQDAEERLARRGAAHGAEAAELPGWLKHLAEALANTDVSRWFTSSARPPRRDRAKAKLAKMALKDEGLLGPSEVPGLTPSPKFSTRVIGLTGVAPANLFTFYSEAGTTSEDEVMCNGFFQHLERWSHSWVNLEMRRSDVGKDTYLPVTIELKKLWGNKSISRALVTPAKGEDVSVRIEGGVALITIKRPMQVVVDVDAYMAETDTGPLYEGPPIHTFSIFANRELAWKPDLSSSDVLVVQPGQAPPAKFSQSTMFFAPGVHELPTDDPYVLLSGKTYFLHAGAWLKGPLRTVDEVSDLRVLGYGTLSGGHISRSDPCDAEGQNSSPEAFVTNNATNSQIIGPTFVDYPNHHLMMFGGEDRRRPNVLADVKVIGWRANGDGAHVFNYWRVSDLFLRTQDDSLYIASKAKQVSFSRISTWNDANGASFIFTAAAGGGNTVLTDSDALFSRASWPYWSGGRVFSLRGLREGEDVTNVLIDGVRALDPYPTMPFLDINAIRPVQTTQSFLLHPTLHRTHILRPTLTLAARVRLSSRLQKRLQRSEFEHEHYNRRKARHAFATSVSNVTFSNIVVRSFSHVYEDERKRPLKHGLPNIINGTKATQIMGLRFDNVSIAGQPLRELIQDSSVFFVGRSTGVQSVLVDGHEII
eukprot:TRINITY_DN30985_c0_g1_i1.p1 TRINITY_DN30985_c0_g1~~TRINITY_DN30985_c0_g1_i1.p1  ORF type:complete len:719 (+),score=141.28 TRINITY_DN30985_c0_g1_i1:48-2159(+)